MALAEMWCSMVAGVGGADCHALPVGSGGLLVGTNLALHAAVISKTANFVEDLYVFDKINHLAGVNQGSVQSE